MATRSYKVWNTTSHTNYTPSYTYRRKPEEPTYYNPYSYYPSYYRSHRSLENTGSRTYPRSGGYGSRFDFVNGRYSDDYRFTCLRDAEEPTYYQELTDLYLTTSKLQQDYRDILDRYSEERKNRNIGTGLPEGYGPPRYSNPDRLPASERYGIYDRRPRYGNSRYDTEVTQYDPPYPAGSYNRASREEYQGSLGNVLYNKDMHKGSYNIHENGPRSREDLELWEYDRNRQRADRREYEGYGHDPRDYSDGYGRYGGRDYGREREYLETGDNIRQHGDVPDRVTGGGLKKSASRADVEDISKTRSMGEGLAPVKDDFDSDSDLERELSGKFDSGIDSPEDDALPIMEEDDLLDTLEEEVDIIIPEPTPEICVYNEISQEDFAEMQEQLKAEDEREKPLCDYPLIATVTTQHLKLEKIVGEFKTPTGDEAAPVPLSPLPGMTSCYVTSPIPAEELQASLAADLTTSDPLTHTPEVKEVTLEFERETTPLGVSAEVVQIGEETIVTETEEEVVEHIPAESTVPDEVHLTLEPELPEQFGEIVAKPVEQTPAPEVVAPAVQTEGEVTMKQAPVEKEQETLVEHAEVAPVSLKIDSSAAKIIEEETNKTAINGEVEEKKGDDKKEVKKEVNEKVEEGKQELKEEVKDESKEVVQSNGKEAKHSENASPKTETKAKVEEPQAPAEKKGKAGKFGQSKFGQKSSAPAGSPKKKRLW